MNSFLSELKQRRVYRVAIGYAVSAWLAIQISATIIPAYHGPDWILPIFITAIALGFPVALVLGWAFDIRGGAIEKADASAAVSGANRWRVWLLAGIGLLLSLIVVGGFWWWRESRTQPPSRAESVQSPGRELPSPSTSAIVEKSIAVLPFENLSEDK